MFFFVYLDMRHVFSIKFLYSNYKHELDRSNHGLALEFDSLNMDYRNPRHSHDNDVCVNRSFQNLFYIRDTPGSEARTII